MGGGGVDVEGPGGVSPSGVHMDHGDDGKMCDVLGVVISPYGGGTRISGLTTHT